MQTTMTLNWLDNMTFDTELNGHKLTLDATAEVGGQDQGPRPKGLMMVALSGCTAMDVISILKKMRVTPDKFQIHVRGELAEEHPKRYEKMHLVYEFTGKDLPADKLQKAVELSQDKYCGVSANYRQAMELTYEIKVNQS